MQAGLDEEVRRRDGAAYQLKNHAQLLRIPVVRHVVRELHVQSVDVVLGLGDLDRLLSRPCPKVCLVFCELVAALDHARVRLVVEKPGGDDAGRCLHILDHEKPPCCAILEHHRLVESFACLQLSVVLGRQLDRGWTNLVGW